MVLLAVIIITITNKDGTKTTITVPEGVETEVRSAAGSKVAITQEGDAAAETPDRTAAAWVLSVGGKVTLIDFLGNSPPIVDGRLPPGDWQLQTVKLTDCKSVADDDLRRFARCRGLATLFLNNTPVTGTGLVHLQDLDNLDWLQIENAKLTDETARFLASLQSLTSLDISYHTSLSDRVLEHVGKLTHLTSLGINDCAISDAGIPHLQQLTKLRALHIGGTRLTDAGLTSLLPMLTELQTLTIGYGVIVFESSHSLACLANAPQLREAKLSGELIPEESLPLLKRHDGLTRIELHYPVTAEAAARLAEVTNVTRLHMVMNWNWAPDPGDQGYAALAKHPTLEEFTLSGGGKSPTDASLAALAALPKLKHFSLNFNERESPRQYTPAGIEAFRKARPDVHLNVDGKDYPATTSSKAPPDYAAERQAAEWALSVGGTVTLLDASGAPVPFAAGQLPAGEWTVQAISLNGCQQVHDDDLQRIGKLRSLEFLYLMDTPVTDAGVKSLGSLSRLTALDMNFCNVGDDSMQTIAGLRNLRQLWLAESSVGDAGLAKLTTLTRLEDLHVGARVTDDGLKVLSSVPRLDCLSGLKSHHLTEAGISHLWTMPHLEKLNIVAATDADVDRIKPLNGLKHLSLNFNQLTKTGLQTLKAFPNLEVLHLGETPTIDDAAVMLLCPIQNLKVLRLGNVGVSPAGIEAFRKARPDVHLFVDGKDYPAAPPTGATR